MYENTEQKPLLYMLSLGVALHYLKITTARYGGE